MGLVGWAFKAERRDGGWGRLGGLLKRRGEGEGGVEWWVGWAFNAER